MYVHNNLRILVSAGIKPTFFGSIGMRSSDHATLTNFSFVNKIYHVMAALFSND
jgi:hypothetical protein